MSSTGEHQLSLGDDQTGVRAAAGSTGDLQVQPRVSVVVPARNEARNLPHVLSEIPRNVHEVILVDGHSVDDTIEVARQCWPGIRVITQTRRGKGNALACGFAEVTGDIVVMLDADGSADPGEIPAFVRALLDGADFAKGTRFARGGSSTDITRFRRIGNAFLNGMVNTLFGTGYTDLCYGYNAFWASLLPVLDLPAVSQDGLTSADMLWGDGFEIETLINVRVASRGARIAEVGSAEVERIHGVSNLNAVSDGLRVLRTIVHERHRVAQNRRRGIVPPQVADTGSWVDVARLDPAAGSPAERTVPAGTRPLHAAIPTPSRGLVIDLHEAGAHPYGDHLGARGVAGS